jgi:glycosyltransferase involved in cell wall biosynthesis
VSAASARVRIANHVPFLAEHGIDLRFESTLSAEEYALLSSSAAPASKALVLGRSALRAIRLPSREGLLVIHRLLTLTPLPGFDPPRGLDVYDYDDALLTGYAADSNRRFQWTKQEARRAAACMRAARLVLTGNRTLAAHALPFAKRVEVIPSCVDPSIQPMHVHKDADELVIGWIGSHTTVAYLQPLLPVIERLANASRRVKLVVVGGDTGVRADWIEHRQWSLETQAQDIADFDIGVMPLPDDDWTRGKSGYKLLQYFAAGVPAVASPVGVNVEFIADGRGLAATTAAEWEASLIGLLGDAQTRAACGQRARQFVEANYSYQRWAPELADLLRSLS